jgi:hypothetical protein
MLIVAIPKSASTSLLETLGRAHRLSHEQTFFAKAPLPGQTNLLHELHSDVRELGKEEATAFARRGIIHKQHVPPTPNNLELLRDQRKVILLREPEKIVAAYRRAVIKHIHKRHAAFSDVTTADEWQQRAGETGLLRDLHWFQEKWLEEAHAFPEHCLVIQSQDLIRDPLHTINTIEKFWGLAKSERVQLSKQRYSRHGLVRNTLTTLKYRLYRLKKALRGGAGT